jgi:hypothetical protein
LQLRPAQFIKSQEKDTWRAVADIHRYRLSQAL